MREFAIATTICLALTGLSYCGAQLLTGKDYNCQNTAPLNCRENTATKVRDFCECQTFDHRYEFRWAAR